MRKLQKNNFFFEFFNKENFILGKVDIRINYKRFYKEMFI